MLQNVIRFSPTFLGKALLDIDLATMGRRRWCQLMGSSGAVRAYKGVTMGWSAVASLMAIACLLQLYHVLQQHQQQDWRWAQGVAIPDHRSHTFLPFVRGGEGCGQKKVAFVPIFC